MQMTAVCMACTIFELYKVLQIEVVRLAQKLFGVSNYSVMIVEAGSFCHQMGQPLKTSQSEREAVCKEFGYLREKPLSIPLFWLFKDRFLKNRFLIFFPKGPTPSRSQFLPAGFAAEPWIPLTPRTVSAGNLSCILTWL